VYPIASVKWKQRVTIEGRIKIVQVGTTAGKSLEAQVFDSSGGMRLLFFGRTRIPGIEPGSLVRVSGTVGEYKGHLALANPRYELLPPDAIKPDLKHDGKKPDGKKLDGKKPDGKKPDGKKLEPKQP
jgi:RecG-like helicase